MSYNIAVYLRLSDDDNDINTIKTESDSISGQRIIIRNFINSQAELKNSNIKEYCDDGYSGVNFKRPSIVKLLDDVKSGMINCIIVKDLSRFGRNFVEVGDYLEQIFPVFNVRFIAVNDNYDSVSKSSYTSGIEVAFKNLMNEEYSKDISKKIKSVKKTQKKQGFYIGGFAPFGYKSENKRLVIDNYAADIVRQIFKMAENGISFLNIAKVLNTENVPTRSKYLGLANQKDYWRARDVSNILYNEVYIGTLVNNQRETISPNVVKKNSSGEWLVFENQHEAIIDKTVFDKVQKRFRKIKQRKSDKNYYAEFKKKVYCKGCGHLLQRHYITSDYRKNKDVISFFYRCDYETADNCCSDEVYIEQLKEVVINSIKVYANLILNKISAIKQNYADAQNKESESISVIDNEIAQIESKVLVEYTNYRSGVISKEEFISRRKKLSDEIYALNLQKEKSNACLKIPDSVVEAEKIFKDFIADETVSNELINSLVNKIHIASDKKIEIDWNFKDIFDISI